MRRTGLAAKALRSLILDLGATAKTVRTSKSDLDDKFKATSDSSLSSTIIGCLRNLDIDKLFKGADANQGTAVGDGLASGSGKAYLICHQSPGIAAVNHHHRCSSIKTTTTMQSETVQSSSIDSFIASRDVSSA